MTNRKLVPAGGFIDSLKATAPEAAEILAAFSMAELRYAILYHNIGNHAETCRMLGISSSTRDARGLQTMRNSRQ